MSKRSMMASVALVAALAFLFPPATIESSAPVASPTVSASPTPKVTKEIRAPKPARSRAPGPDTLSDLPQVWQDLAWCESRHKLHAVSPGKTYYGLWQLHKGFYNVFDIDPETATFRQQWKVAQYVYDRQGAGAWSCADYANLQ